MPDDREVAFNLKCPTEAHVFHTESAAGGAASVAEVVGPVGSEG